MERQLWPEYVGQRNDNATNEMHGQRRSHNWDPNGLWCYDYSIAYPDLVDKWKLDARIVPEFNQWKSLLYLFCESNRAD